MNPFAEQWSSHSGQPSVFGALPFAAAPSTPHLIPFTFQFRNSILNSEVVGPNDRIYYRIATDERQNMFTAFHGQQGNAGHIEWRPTTLLEFNGTIPRQRATDWVHFDSRTGSVSLFSHLARIERCSQNSTDNDRRKTILLGSR